MATAFLSESDLLRKLAVSTFNLQFGRNLVASDCSIRSIPPQYSKTLGYEIITNSTTDYVRLKIFLDYGSGDQLYDYRLETDKSILAGSLEDEVYAAVGTISETYRDLGIYKFRTIGAAAVSDSTVVDSSGAVFEWEEGGAMEWTT